MHEIPEVVTGCVRDGPLHAMLVVGPEEWAQAEAEAQRLVKLGICRPPSLELVRAAKRLKKHLGYLMLDALIGNGDRHHENWAIIERQPGEPAERYAELAPTFDHASSLGRELSDEDRTYKLSPGRRDQTIEGYLDRARSAIYANETASKPLSPIQAFELAEQRRRAARRAWLEQLARIPLMEFNNSVDRVPGERMSASARKFALRLLESTRSRLLSKVDA